MKIMSLQQFLLLLKVNKCQFHSHFHMKFKYLLFIQIVYVLEMSNCQVHAQVPLFKIMRWVNMKKSVSQRTTPKFTNILILISIYIFIMKQVLRLVLLFLSFLKISNQVKMELPMILELFNRNGSSHLVLEEYLPTLVFQACNPVPMNIQPWIKIGIFMTDM